MLKKKVKVTFLLWGSFLLGRGSSPSLPCLPPVLFDVRYPLPTDELITD